MSYSETRPLPPWYFFVPAIAVGTGVLLPLVYLLVRAFEAETAELFQIVFRIRTLYLFGNTLRLAIGVMGSGALLAMPLAWLTTRTDLKGVRFFTLMGVLPLAIPGYVMAYALLGLSGPNGTFAELFGTTLPRFRGYWGALIALSFYTFPYLFLNVRSALLGLDVTIEESARSLGSRSWEVFGRIILPQLRPAFYAGGLLVGLHVLGDFGVVSLMRYETFSYALYTQYTASYDRTYAAWLALMLLALAGSLLYLEARLLREKVFHRAGTGTARGANPIALGRWQIPAYFYLATLVLASVVAPTVAICFWMVKGFDPSHLRDFLEALSGSLMASTPAAFLTAGLAIPLAYLGVRYSSSICRALERGAYIGYATPPLAFALALIFFTLRVVPGVYQTLWILIYAYTLHFLAEAIGPVRSALYQASPRLEETARSLGYPPFKAFLKATFPLLRSGLMVSTAFVFLAAMKELPLTFLLSPVGYETLAVNVWSYTTEAMFAEAAPYALAILIFSALFVGLLLIRDTNQEYRDTIIKVSR
ncbi:MAG: iron ABC transporter permease [Candidatus Poribacteria bacterium]|nr:iron ABC transporter permease [Candidatus Poribacteria bacterium]